MDFRRVAFSSRRLWSTVDMVRTVGAALDTCLDQKMVDFICTCRDDIEIQIQMNDGYDRLLILTIKCGGWVKILRNPQHPIAVGMPSLSLNRNQSPKKPQVAWIYRIIRPWRTRFGYWVRSSLPCLSLHLNLNLHSCAASTNKARFAVRDQTPTPVSSQGERKRVKHETPPPTFGNSSAHRLHNLRSTLRLLLLPPPTFLLDMQP